MCHRRAAYFVARCRGEHRDHGTTGFSIYEGQYVPAASADWTVFADAIQFGLAVRP